MTSDKKTSKPLTAEQKKKLDQLIEEGERLFGTRTSGENPYLTRSAKNKKDGSSSSKSSRAKSKGKAADSSKKEKSSPASCQNKSKKSGTSASSSDKSKKSNAASASKTSKSSTSPKSAKAAPTGSKNSGGTSAKGKSVSSPAPASPQPTAGMAADALKRIPKWVVQAAALIVCALLIWMFCEANVIQLKSAELFLPQLPYAFKGTRVMYISDLHINSLNSPSKVNNLIDQVMQLEPDLLLLGGDYTTLDPLMYVSGSLSGSTTAQVQEDMRNLFFENLAQYSPKFGKFAAAGEHDNLLNGSGISPLEASAAKGGVTLLRNDMVRIEHGGQSIVIMGIDDWTQGEKDVSSPARMVSASDCVIVLCHNPEAVPLLNSYPASDGFWIDLALCGHTHGGIARLGSLELFNSTSDPTRYAAGWHLENTARVLISRGVANDLLPLRFFAAPEVHLITLK